MRGVVWPQAAAKPGEKPIATAKMKRIAKTFPGFRLAADVIDFIDWVADYTLFPRGTVLRMVMRGGTQLDAPKPQTGYFPADKLPDDLRLTPARRKSCRCRQGPEPTCLRPGFGDARSRSQMG